MTLTIVLQHSWSRAEGTWLFFVLHLHQPAKENIISLIFLKKGKRSPAENMKQLEDCIWPTPELKTSMSKSLKAAQMCQNIRTKENNISLSLSGIRSNKKPCGHLITSLDLDKS